MHVLSMSPREWRKREDLKPRDVAAWLGCSVPSLYNYETGKRDVPNRIVVAFEKISKGKVTSDDLHAVRRGWLRTSKAAA